MIVINIDEKKVKRAYDALSHIEDGAPRAISAAINRAVDSVKTEITREVRKEYYVNAGAVQSTIKIKRASALDLRATIRSKGSPIALSKFRITPNKAPGKKGTTPVRAKVKKTGGNNAIPGTFVARMESGHVGVFIRVGNKRKKVRKDNKEVWTGAGPIEEKFGPSIPQMIGNKEIEKFIEKRYLERFDERLDHEIDRILKGVGN